MKFKSPLQEEKWLPLPQNAENSYGSRFPVFMTQLLGENSGNNWYSDNEGPENKVFV